MKITKFLTALLLAIALTPAFAQTSWTGFHAGVNLGRANGGIEESPNFWVTYPKASGAIFGAQIGYDYQISGSRLVFGLETDLQKSGVSGRRAVNFCPGCVGVTNMGATETELKWLGTTRLRAGYAFGKVLPYLTGGVAYGSIKTTTSQRYSDAFGASSWSSSSIQGAVGHVIGAGVDWAVRENISVRLEYLHTDFGISKVDTGFSSREIALKGNLYRVGASYHF